MITFEKRKETDCEIFKISKQSICRTCEKFNEICNLVTFKICGTDRKIGKAYVASCASYENIDSKVSSFDSKRGIKLKG